MPVLRSCILLVQQHTLLLSHVSCFVTASRSSLHHAALALSCALLCLILLSVASTLLCLSITLLLLSHLALSQHHAAHVCSIRFAFSCAACCMFPSHVHCFVSNHAALQGITLSCSLCALLCPAQHHDAPQHHAAHVPCVYNHAALQC